MNKSEVKFENISSSPGIYQFMDSKGKILYIGKAKNLRNRLRQYFQINLDRGPGIVQMVEIAEKFETIETDSEIEAILLEAELINKIKPKYNVRAKDDKSFLVIRITKKISNFQLPISSKFPITNSQISNIESNDRAIEPLTDFPSVELVRARNVDFTDKNYRYFGPYPSGDLLKNALKYLRKIFPYRDCSKTKYSTQKRKQRPCVFGEIRVCTAPCAGFIGPAGYQKNTGYLIKYLQNNKQKLMIDLEKEMSKLSKSKKFEEAAQFRDKIKALNHLHDVAIGLSDEIVDPSSLLFKRIECYDISNNTGRNVVGSMVVFTDGKANKDEYRLFEIKDKKSQSSDIYSMKEMLERRFKNEWPLPDLLIVDGGQTQLNIAINVIKNAGKKIPVVAIAKGAERKRNDFLFSDETVAVYIKSNPNVQKVLIRARDEAHRFAISYYRRKHTKELFSK